MTPFHPPRALLQVIIDKGSIAEEVKRAGGADKVLELIGISTLEDSLKCANKQAIVCMCGAVANKWSFNKEFSPMGSIPTSVGLTVYSGGPVDFMATPLNELVQKIAAGKLKITTGKVFKLDEIVEAHQCMEGNLAGGKLVVLT